VSEFYQGLNVSANVPANCFWQKKQHLILTKHQQIHELKE